MGRTDTFPIIFLDRDGTIIVDKVYLNDPDEVEFIDGVIEGLQRLVKYGFKLVIVTNQSGIGRGIVKIENLFAIHRKIEEILKTYGVELFKIYYCPHLPEENCFCRKPKTGMVEEIKMLIDKCNSFVIGDKDTDVNFGKNLGIRTILLSKTGGKIPDADFVVKNFTEAVDIVLQNTKL
ncbi:MAG: HAD family hydrolase [Endomicrobia bacterium]|nr:HAD family hydrolase [Endomicrobiia bacterium]